VPDYEAIFGEARSRAQTRPALSAAVGG